MQSSQNTACQFHVSQTVTLNPKPSQTDEDVDHEHQCSNVAICQACKIFTAGSAGLSGNGAAVLGFGIQVLGWGLDNRVLAGSAGF